MSARVRFSAVVLAAVLVATVAAPASGSATHRGATLSCGDTITTDTTLTANLTGCENNGIVIGADGIRLDLNGHTISGDGSATDPCPGDDPCDVGVFDDGFDAVTIEGGSVRKFDTGVLGANSEHLRIRHLRSSGNAYNGLILFKASRSGISSTEATGNGLETDFPGVAIVESRQVAVSHTSSTGNGDLGLYVVSSNRSRFSNDDLSGNPEAGAIIDGNRNRIAENRVSRTGDGLIVSGDHNVIAANRIRARGCGRECGIGISLEGGKGNAVVRNRVMRAKNVGVRLDVFGRGSHLRRTVIAGNRIHDAGRDGLFVGAKVDGTTVARNYVYAASRDGIHVRAKGTRISGNTANNNRALGISAVQGVIDGGGNHAHGNGSPAQCTVVVCGSHRRPR